MRLSTISLAVASLLVASSAQAVTREKLADYYQSADGLKKEALKTALYNILVDHTQIPYGSGSSKSTWWAFYVTDQTSDGKVLNRYSSAEFSFGTRGSAVSGMNIEHSFPKSWWGGTKNAAYKDLFNLYPSPSADNSQKSNYPMSKVVNVKYDSGEGYDKVGTGSVNGSTQSCWEPGDGWKGDFARAYMYMAVCYQDFTWTGTGLQTLESDTWPTLRQWAYELYRQWSASDKVDNIETARVDAVYGIQGNRNPFVDYPFLCEYIWGDSIDVVFDPANAITTASDDSRYGSYEPTPTPEPEPSPYIFYADCSSYFGDMTETLISPTDGTLSSVWQQSTSYGWKASAYVKSTNYASEATLETPELDLTDYSSATLTFSHAANYVSGDITDVLSVEVECDGDVTVLTVPTWPSGSSWTYVESGDVSLDAFAGKKIKVIFRYTSTSSSACTWELKTIKVDGVKSSTAITDIESTPQCAPDFTQPYEAYLLNGMKVKDVNSVRGIVVVRQGGNSWLIRRP